MVAFPHNPQEDALNKCRVSRSKSTVTPSAKNTRAWFSFASKSIREISPGEETMPSVSRNPAASSSSWPGVLIRTATE